MRHHCIPPFLLFLILIFICIDLYAQDKNPDSCDVYIISKGQGCILCNEQYKVDSDDRKEFILKNNADVKLLFSPEKGHVLSKFTINGINRFKNVENNQITLKGISRKTTIVATFGRKDNANDSVKLTVISGSGGELIYNGELIVNTKKSVTVRKGSTISLKCNPLKGYKLEKLSVNGILRDAHENTYSFEIQRNSVVNAAFSIVRSANPNNSGDSNKNNSSDNKNNSSSIRKKKSSTREQNLSENKSIQRYRVDVSTNIYGYHRAGFLLSPNGDNSYLIHENQKGRLWLAAKEHCHLEKLVVNGTDMSNEALPSQTKAEGPTYEFEVGPAKQNYKIVAIFAPDPKLTISCGKFGSADRAIDFSDPTGYVHYLDPKYSVNPGESTTFYEPSAAKTSAFYGKPWILRTLATQGYELARLSINGVDVTSSVKRVYPANRVRSNQETCYISLGFISNDTRVEITFRKKSQQNQSVDWVDLGTGVKWATRNVGADDMAKSGNYYTWKEANALKVQQGRLPTYDEIMRLINECHPEFTQQNGVNGIRFYHRSNRSISIFIPASGIYPEYGDSNTLSAYSEEGAIWTSTQTGSAKKMGEAMKEHTMNPIWLIIGDIFSSDGYDRAALAFSVKEKIVKSIDADIGARINVRLVLDK